MKRQRRTVWLGVAAMALLAAACSTADETPALPDGSSTTAVAVSSSTVGPDTTSAPTSSTEAPADSSSTTSTTSASTTTTTVIENPPVGGANIAMTQVVFGATPYIVLTNVGQSDGTLRGLWMCQRPNYFELPPTDLGPGEAVAISVGPGEVPDLIGISEVIDSGSALGSLDARDGEVALYTDAAFSDPTAIIGYVRWGDSADLGRTETAVAAGLWTEGGTVDVPSELLVLTAARLPATGPDDWIAEIGG